MSVSIIIFTIGKGDLGSVVYPLVQDGTDDAEGILKVGSVHSVGQLLVCLSVDLLLVVVSCLLWLLVVGW